MALPPLDPPNDRSPNDRPTDRRPDAGDAGIDRDRFYADPVANPPVENQPVDDDPDEYEVEEVDQAILDHAKEQARQELKRAETAIDVDEIYRELDQRAGLDGAFEEFRARFSLRSLLWVMTGVALLLGLGGSGFFSNGTVFAVLIVAAVVGLAAAHAWLNHRERTRRAELLAKRAEQLRVARRLSGDPEDEDLEATDEPEPLPKGGVFASVADGLKLKRRVGLGELMVAVLIASVLVGLLALVGSPARAAAALGAIAVLGFALQAAEIEVPRAPILAWWLALIGYCLTTLLTWALGVASWAAGAG